MQIKIDKILNFQQRGYLIWWNRNHFQFCHPPYLQQKAENSIFIAFLIIHIILIVLFRVTFAMNSKVLQNKIDEVERDILEMKLLKRSGGGGGSKSNLEEESNAIVCSVNSSMISLKHYDTVSLFPLCSFSLSIPILYWYFLDSCSATYDAPAAQHFCKRPSTFASVGIRFVVSVESHWRIVRSATTSWRRFARSHSSDCAENFNFLAKIFATDVSLDFP